MKPIQVFLLPLGCVFFSLHAWSQSWTGSLENGGIVSMDPQTHKATIYSESGATQLWDGTHRMQDGSVMIVREGVVISGPGVQSDSQMPTVQEQTGGAIASSACVELVIKVCGFNGECKEAPPCSPARQLMQLEKDEAWQTRSQGPNQTTAQCRQALDNESYFVRCDVKRPSKTPTACEILANQVCGDSNQCAESEPCSAATQLLSMETQERLISRTPERPTYTSNKCRELTKGSEFFIPCRSVSAEEDAGGNGSEKPQSEMPPAPLPIPDQSHQ